MSGWQVTESVDVAPQIYSAVYFIHLTGSNKCLYSSEMNHYGAPTSMYGDIEQLAANFPGCPLIPVDPHHALSLNWITVDEMATEMPYINDNIKACLRLIKDIKGEGNGDDTEGLRTSS